MHSLELGVIDGIVPEPDGGAQTDHDEAARLLGEALELALDEVEGTPLGHPPARAEGEIPADGHPRMSEIARNFVRFQHKERQSTLSTGLSPIHTEPQSRMN